MSTFDMSGEKYPHLVSGEFNARVTAEKAINTLLRRGELKRKQVDLIQPDDKHLGRKVEPESPGVRHTLMRSHAIFGVGGLVAGLVLASVLVILGPEATRSSPLMTFIGLGIISTFLGLLVAGLFTLRPDHDHVLSGARDASEEGHWTVVAHCASQEQRNRAVTVLEECSEDTSKSL